MNGGLSKLMNAPLWLQRVAALALFAVVVLAAAGSVLAATNVIAAKRADLLAERERSGHLARIVAYADKFDPAANGPAAADIGALFLQAESPAIARANLQTRVNQLAARQKLGIASIGTVPDREENGYRLIGLRADVTGSFEALHALIMNAESVMPPLLIQEMTLRRVNLGQNAKNPDQAVLSGQLRIYAAFQQLDPVKEAAKAKAEAMN